MLVDKANLSPVTRDYQVILSFPMAFEEFYWHHRVIYELEIGSLGHNFVQRLLLCPTDTRVIITKT